MQVSFARCNKYEQEAVRQAVSRSVELIGGWKAFVKKGDKVLVKPNMLGAKEPHKAVTTHPAVLSAVLEALIKAGAKPCVGDSPAAESLEHVSRVCGISEVCERLKVPIVHFRNCTSLKVPNTTKEFPVYSDIGKYDLVVNIPKLKTHMQTVYTGAVKNLFGLIPGRLKSKYHLIHPTGHLFSEMLLDLYSAVKPQLSIMDAVVAMHGLGPSYGLIKQTGFIAASDDALSLDMAVINMLKIEKKVPIALIAQKRNIGNYALKGDTIKVTGFKVPGFLSAADTIRTKLLEILRFNLLKECPAIDTKKCVGCRHCANICSFGAMQVQEIAVIDYAKCRRCYCCYEVCPHGAISIKRLLKRFI